MDFALRAAAFPFSALPANDSFPFLPVTAQGRLPPLARKIWMTAYSL
jgi:hypothetical protein